MTIELPRRPGPRPTTTPTNPHMQLDQQPSDGGPRDELARRVFALEGVEERPTRISVPGARALWLRDDVQAGSPEAFMIEREFAHLHPDPDHSLHMTLPYGVVGAALEQGWAELHPVAARGLIPKTSVMVYAPRDGDEVDIVFRLVETSWRFASGELAVDA
jgi:hypothetical protein